MCSFKLKDFKSAIRDSSQIIEFLDYSAIQDESAREKLLYKALTRRAEAFLELEDFQKAKDDLARIRGLNGEWKSQPETDLF